MEALPNRMLPELRMDGSCYGLSGAFTVVLPARRTVFILLMEIPGQAPVDAYKKPLHENPDRYRTFCVIVHAPSLT